MGVQRSIQRHLNIQHSQMFFQGGKLILHVTSQLFMQLLSFPQVVLTEIFAFGQQHLVAEVSLDIPLANESSDDHGADSQVS